MNRYPKFYLLYDDEDEGNEEGEEGDPKEKSFTQEEVNKMLATDRRKHEEKLKKTITDLETLKTSKSLTDKEKTDLTKRIEELQDQVLTKEQLAEKDKAKLKKDYDKKLDTTTVERDTWRSRFEDTLVINSIHEAASEQKAIDNNQIIALIKAQSPRIVEVLDESGEPTGKYVPKVKVQDFDDKEKKEVTLDLTITEAVKRMKEKPENYNLFESTSEGGLGLDSGAGRRTSDAPPVNDPAAYRKWRKKNLRRQ